VQDRRNVNTTKRPLRERVEIDSRKIIQTIRMVPEIYMNINDKDEE